MFFLRLRCEGILARALIDWPRLLVAKAASFSDFIETVNQAILRHSQIWLIAVLVFGCTNRAITGIWLRFLLDPAIPALQDTLRSLKKRNNRSW